MPVRRACKWSLPIPVPLLPLIVPQRQCSQVVVLLMPPAALISTWINEYEDSVDTDNPRLRMRLKIGHTFQRFGKLRTSNRKEACVDDRKKKKKTGMLPPFQSMLAASKQAAAKRILGMGKRPKRKRSYSERKTGLPKE